jgi:hypothetical protein
MTIRQKIETLASEKGSPCVTIMLNTHRTHPDNLQDAILLKNFLKEAEERVINEFGKRSVVFLLEKLSEIEIDVNYNLDSLHIYISNNTKEIYRSTWPVKVNGVHISDTFDIRSLIKSYNRSEEYFILLLSQNGVNLYEALNDGIITEIRNNDFPFSENRHFNKGNDAKHQEDSVREFLNKVDKAVVRIHNETGFHCVVICTAENHNRLLQIADVPNIYYGYSDIDNNNTATHHIAAQSWNIIQELQRKQRTKAIIEIKEAVGHGTVLTDLQEIYQASIDGRGDLLVVHQDFAQPVLLTSDRTFELVTDTNIPNAIDDITSNIAWEVLSKKGRVVFTIQDEIKELGQIVLKTRY